MFIETKYIFQYHLYRFARFANKVTAESKIKELDLGDMGLTLNPHKKDLPKLTVSRIPLEVLEMECGSSLSITDGDDMTKKTLINVILKKSAELKEMSQLGHTMEVIYINTSVKYMNQCLR